MNSLLRLGVCLLVLHSTFLLSAQPVETYTFVFPIQKVHANIDMASVAVGTEHLPIKTTTKGIVIGKYDTKSKERNTELGQFAFDAIDNAESSITINPTHESYAIEANDLIQFELPIIAPQPNIFFDLGRYHIGLQDIYSKTMYNVEKALISPADFDETALLQALSKEIHFVAKAMRQQMKAPMIKEGRYKGLDLFTAMEQSESSDVYCFLQYVIEHPKKYMGNNWKISEIYATWLDGGSPASAASILTNLQKVKEEKFKTIATNTANMNNHIETWRNEASTLIESKQFTEANTILEVCHKAALLTENTEQIAWCYFNKSQLLEKQEQNDDAIIELNRALELFKDLDNAGAVLTAYNNLGNLYNQVGAYDQAIDVLKKAYEINEPLLKKNSEVLNGIAALISKNLGISYMSKRKYKKALKYFQQGLSLIEYSTSTRLIKRKAAIYYHMGELYNNMGKSEEAKKYEDQAIELYKTLLYPENAKG